MTDAFSSIFGGPTTAEAVDAARLELFKSFEDADRLLELWDADPREVVRYLLLVNMAQGGLISLLIHKPEGTFASLYPLDECVKMVNDEFMRRIRGEGNDD